MEKHKTCSFFGHRKIDITNELQYKLKEVIEDLIINQNTLTFLFGSQSDFDKLCHTVVTNLKKKYPKIKRIAYTCKNEKCILEHEKEQWEKRLSLISNKTIQILSFDEEFEHSTKYTSGRSSYIERNQAMINNSDICIFYYDNTYQPKTRKYYKHSNIYYQPNSGTRLAFKYAEKKNKTIINIKEYLQ